jgi:hypothetical protein
LNFKILSFRLWFSHQLCQAQQIFCIGIITVQLSPFRARLQPIGFYFIGASAIMAVNLISAKKALEDSPKPFVYA